MSRNNLVSWGEWKEGVANMHDFQMVLEAKLDTGAALTPEQVHLLEAARRVTARYERNGHRKDRFVARPTSQTPEKA
jgi:hypothetical protein